MEKAIIGILTAIMALSSGAAAIVPAEKEIAPQFVDVDQNGVCDNFENNSCYIDEDADGVCDNFENGPCYIDEDNNGVCDDYDERHHGYTNDNGSGRGHGRNCEDGYGFRGRCNRS